MRAPKDESAAPAPPRLTYLIGRVDRAVRRRLATALDPLGLTLTQYTTLAVLRRRPGLSNAQLARRALTTPQSMIQLLSGLEDRALVAREPDPAHGRVLRATLTPAGDALLDHAEAATADVEALLRGTPPGEASARAQLDAWAAALADEPTR